MWNIALSLFLTGMFLGVGPCLISCGPFLLFFIAGAQKSPREGLLIWLVFSLSRLVAYLVLGFACGLLSQKIIHRFLDGNTSRYIGIAAGTFIILVGLSMVLGKSARRKICRQMEAVFVKRSLKSAAIFGLFIGFLPCAPLLAVLSYIAMISQTWLKGIWYSLAFGMGTLVSPLVILALLASLVPKIFSRKEHLLSVFQLACGLMIVLLGVLILIKIKGG